MKLLRGSMMNHLMESGILCVWLQVITICIDTVPLTSYQKQLHTSVSVFLVHIPSSVVEFVLLRGMEERFSVFSDMYSKSMVGLLSNGN